MTSENARTIGSLRVKQTHKNGNLKHASKMTVSEAFDFFLLMSEKQKKIVVDADSVVEVTGMLFLTAAVNNIKFSHKSTTDYANLIFYEVKK